MRQSRALRAVLTCLIVGVVGTLLLGQCACTIGQTRIAFGASLAADIGSTAVGLNNGHSEANPVVSWSPTVMIAVTSVAFVVIAEYLARNDHARTAQTLYTISTILHAGAAGWKLQLSKQKE